MRVWVGWWILLAALYLWLADNPKPPELVVGAVAAAIGATGAVLVRRQRRALLQPRRDWLREGWRPLLGLFGDLVPLVRALPRRGATAGLAEIPLGEPALTEALGSLAPNSIVVEVDHERGVALVHRLVP